MKQSQIRLSFLFSMLWAVLLTGALVSAAMTYWALNKTREWDERIALANESYTEHLALQANLFRLFKENADALLIGDRDRSEAEQAIATQINENLDAIRQIIAREIEVDGEEEYEELLLLATIERRIDEVKRRYESLVTRSRNSGATPIDELVSLLDRDIDGVLSDLISVALAGEREEVEETSQEATLFRTAMAQAALGIVFGMVALTVVVALVYRRYAAIPLESLMRGAEAFRAGDYGYAISPNGATEMRRLAETLTDMAQGIAVREQSLTDQARKLEQRVAERTSELQSLLTRFEQVEASRRQMMADVSHELRTPLTIIQGEADVAMRGGGQDVDQTIDSLGRIREAARHSNRIVDDLLTVAREEAGQLRLDLRSLDLDAALAEVADMAQAPVTVMRAGKAIVHRVDPLRFRQCILAVMNNAVRYGATDVRAWVEQRASGPIVVVEDNGPGMSDEEKDQAFIRFFRGSGATGTGVEGTGLGLPIVQSIMSAHGGSVDLSDRTGGGLVVRLHFPKLLKAVPRHDQSETQKSAEL